MSHHRVKRFSVLALLLVVLLALNVGVPAFAGESRSGRQVLVGPGEVIPDDLYVAGETITIDGTVRGDVIAAGSEIRINGTVEGDVILAGRAVWINGAVRDDARIAAYEIQVGERGSIGDDVTLMAFSLNSRPGSQVGGDLYAITRQTTLDGRVSGTVNTVGEALQIGGQVAGNVSADVGRPDPQFGQLHSFLRFSPVPVMPPGLAVNDSAVVSGTLHYRSEGEAIVAPGARVGVIQREAKPVAERERQRERERDRGIGWLILLWIIQQLRRLITLLVFAFLLTWLMPRMVPETAARLRERPWPSLGLGCATEIAFFLAVPILLVLIVAIGLLLGVLTLGGLQTVWIAAGVLLEGLGIIAFIVVTSWVTKIVVAYLVGALLLDRTGARYKSTVWPLLLGIVLYVIARAVPILGWLVGLAATLLGLGALLLWARDRWWPWRRPGPVVPVAGAPVPPGGDASQPSPPTPGLAETGTAAASIGEVFVVTPPEPVVPEPAPSRETNREEAETITVPAIEITEEEMTATPREAMFATEEETTRTAEEGPMPEIHPRRPLVDDLGEEDTGISDRTEPMLEEEIDDLQRPPAIGEDLDREDAVAGVSDTNDGFPDDELDDESMVMAENEDYATADEDQMYTADEMKSLGEEDRVRPEGIGPHDEDDMLEQDDLLSLDELDKEEIAGPEDVISLDELDALDEEPDDDLGLGDDTDETSTGDEVDRK